MPQSASVTRSVLRAVWLARTPTSVGTGRCPGARELQIQDTPFILVYRVEETAVLILRVLHTSRRWPSFEDVRIAARRKERKPLPQMW
ncbi:plasmid stabilization system [Sphingomonas sp. LH128]|nr:plasmid stabilization system [Sphingomonas sp. LH128]